MSGKREVIKEFLRLMEVTDLKDGKRRLIRAKLSCGAIIVVAISMKQKTVKLKLIKTG